MWIRKSDTFSASEGKAKKPFNIIIIFILLSFLIHIISGLQLFSFLLAGILTLLFRKKKPDNTLLCPVCDISKQNDGKMICECGNHFAPISHFEWVDESENVKEDQDDDYENETENGFFDGCLFPITTTPKFNDLITNEDTEEQLIFVDRDIETINNVKNKLEKAGIETRIRNVRNNLVYTYNINVFNKDLATAQNIITEFKNDSIHNRQLEILKRTNCRKCGSNDFYMSRDSSIIDEVFHQDKFKYVCSKCSKVIWLNI
ncbi:hypothetical protein CHISP_3552 [Chitinispirillum alkaliphilum]|nr:hypothetical protein CHISP_3552 [Chitinispirillum alkaliphilum]